MGLFSSKKKTKNQVLRTPEFDQAGSYILRNLPGVFGTGFTPYTGDRIADFTGDELAGFDLVRALSDPTQNDGLDLEQMALDRFSTAPTLEQLSGFMNPYTQAVLDRSAQSTTDLFDRRIADLEARRSHGSAFGGSRFAVERSQLTDDYMDTIADLYTQGNAANFNRAQDMYFKTGLDAFNLSQGRQQSALGRANALLGIGNQQRNLIQSQKDFDYNEFMRRINQPKQDLIAASGVFGSYPVQSFDTYQETKSSPSLFSKIAGVAGLGAGLGGLFGLGGGSSAAGVGMSGFNVPGVTGSPMMAGVMDQMFGNSGGVSSMGAGWTQNRFTGGGAANYINSSNYNPVLPGFKDGGRVRKYADGGGVRSGGRGGPVALRPYADSLASFFGFKHVFDSEEEKNRKKPKSKSVTHKDIMDLFNTGGEDEFDAFAYRTPGINNPFAATPKTNKKKNNKNSKEKLIKEVLGLPTSQPKQTARAPKVQPQDDSDWFDRWMENPLTKVGMAMMSGSGIDGLSGVADALVDRHQGDQREETRQRELAQAQNLDEQRRAEDMAFRQRQLDIQQENYNTRNRLDAARLAATQAQTAADQRTKSLGRILSEKVNLLEAVLRPDEMGFINQDKVAQLEGEIAGIISQMNSGETPSDDNKQRIVITAEDLRE
jgi:hypothetical protein